MTSCARENSEAELPPSRSRAKQSPVERSTSGTGQKAPSGAHPCVVLQPTFILVGAETPAFMQGEQAPPARSSGKRQTRGAQATAGLVCLTHTPFSFRRALPARRPFEEKGRKLLPNFRPPCRGTGPIPLRDCISGRGPRPSGSRVAVSGWDSSGIPTSFRDSLDSSPRLCSFLARYTAAWAAWAAMRTKLTSQERTLS